MLMRFAITAASACVLLSACSTTTEKTPVPAAPAASSPTAAPVAETEAQREARLMKALGAKSVYFDYDNYAVKPEYQDVLRNDAEFLKSAPQLGVRLEGNADERGSTEYNLALGQKRAEAVKRALKLLGLPEERMEAISYGEEKPRATCHEEKCWAENRRVDLVFRNSAAAK